MKVIAIDLDGTLLNHHKEISKENLTGLQYAKENGYEIVIATGRAYFDARQIIQKAGLSTTIISSNGAVIHSKEGNLINSCSIKISDVEKSVKWLEEFGFYYEVTSNKGIYSIHNRRDILNIELDLLISANPEVDKEILTNEVQEHLNQSGYIFVHRNEQILNEQNELYKILVYSLNEKKRLEGWKHFENHKNLSIVTSANHNFELQNNKSSKGNALEIIANLLSVPLDDTIAIGDNFNDVSMFEKAGISIAMGNAKNEIQSMCDRVTTTNDEHGVSHAIYKMMN